ncbi:unnamed protein product [Closterium sp. Yama58-4]|nr:unnamed protein product [Closterium sp. Yama58-4]
MAVGAVAGGAGGGRGGKEAGGEKAASTARLLRTVLSWDFFHMLALSKVFSSAEEYVDVFERLLLEECRAQILRGAEEQGDMESHLVVAVRCERANEFHMVGVASKEALVADCHDNDLLLLSKEKPWGGSALPSTYAIASVESRETKTSLRLRLCLEDPWQWADPGGPPSTAAATDEEQAAETGPGGAGTEAGPPQGKAQGKGRRWGVRQRARANRMLSFLMGAAATGGSACWVSKLCNTSTISREYAALRSAPSLPYIRTVLASHMPGHAHGQAGTGGAGGAGAGGGGEEEEEGGAGGGQGKQQQWRVPEGLMEHLSASHNESQLRAIKGGLSRRPLVLIQGPPGTGKTQAILGLLSVVLHGRPAHEMGDAGSSTAVVGAGNVKPRHPTVLPAFSFFPHRPSPCSSNGAQHITHMTRLTWQQRQQEWVRASPWLHGVNPREAVQPDDEEESGAGSSGGGVFGSTQQVEVLGGHRKQRAHVLVCAPSNAALDEIVLRLLHTGLRDDSGGMYSPSVVRVGLNAHHSVASVAMDNLVRGGMYSPLVVRVGLNAHHSIASVAMDNLVGGMHVICMCGGMYGGTCDCMVSQRASSMARSAAGVGAKTAGAGGVERDRIRVAILDEAAIVCSTLAFAGSGVFSRMSRPFDVVVIDEAAQAVEPSTLIPMTHGCSQVFMVGDPLQLPATVLSTRAVHYGCPAPAAIPQPPTQPLSTQPHPTISPACPPHQIRQFPSHEFYGGALRDAPQMAQNTARPWHAERVFGPFFFFDLHQSKDEQPPGGSWMNADEAEFVMVLYRHLVALYPQLKESSDVGVISPYKHQVKLLRDKFRELLGEGAHRVDVNTVDGFQGREKDVIIFSCVRAGRGKGKSIGFLSDYRRMNVGITRARSSMLVVANAAALMVDEHWGNLVKHARSTNRYLKVSRPFHRIFASDHLEKMRALAQAEGDGEGAPGAAAGGGGTAIGPAFKRAPTLEDYGGKLDKGDGGVGGEGDGVAEGEGEEEEGEGAMGEEEEFEVAVEAGDFDEDNIDGEGPSW